MGLIALPQRLYTQPQYSPSISPNYRDAEILSLLIGHMGKDLAKGNDLTPVVSFEPVPTVAPHGKALKFSGGQFCNSQRKVNALGLPFTVFAWVRPSALNTGYKRVVETDYSVGFYLGSNTGSKYTFVVANSDLEAGAGGQQVVGQRDFLCGVFNGTNALLYVNGVLVGTTSASASNFLLTVGIGSNPFGGSFWTGDIDTVGLFHNRVFSAKEVASLYANPWQLFQATPRRLFATASAFNSYTIIPSGGVAFAGTNNLIKSKVIVPSGGVIFSGTNPITGTRSYPITPSGGITFGGTGSMTSSNAQTYIITPTGGVTFSGSATVIKTNIVIPLGGIVFSGSAPMTSNTVISTVTTRLPMTGAGA